MKPIYNDNPEQKLMEQPSYDMVVRLTDGALWDSAAEDASGMYVCEIRNAVAGNLIIDTPSSTGVIIPAGPYDIFRVRVTRVLAASTATGITVYGYRRNADIVGGD